MHSIHLHETKAAFLVFFLHVLLNPMWEIQAVRIQQPQEQRYPVLQAHAGSFMFP